MKRLLFDSGHLLSPSDVENADDLIRHGEYGVALELICTQMFEYESQPSAELLQEIAELGGSMGLSAKYWEDLRQNP